MSIGTELQCKQLSHQAQTVGWLPLQQHAEVLDWLLAGGQGSSLTQGL